MGGFIFKVKSQNRKIAKLQNRKIAKLQICKIAKSQNRNGGMFLRLIDA
jgi:hypothetical protein